MTDQCVWELNETIDLAFTGSVTQHATKFLKKFSSTLLLPFLKPAVNAW